MGIETATHSGGVAIIDGKGVVVAVSEETSVQTHSERLMSCVEKVLADAGIDITHIAALGVSIGPGSFTGVRIGMSVAKGLAYAARIPLVAVPTLEALAYRYFEAGKLICPMLDARRSEIYAAIFEVIERKNHLRRIKDDMVIQPKEFLKIIKSPAIFSGTGAIRYTELIKEKIGSLAEFAPEDRILPSPVEVARRALEGYKQHRVADPLMLEPRYIRASDAEIKRAHEKRTEEK